MRTAASVLLCVAASACTPEVKEVCGGTSQKYYDDGLALHLTKLGVPFRRIEGGGLCAPEKYAAQFKAAERGLERYFPQIAYNPKNSCEELAYLGWAKERNLRHDLVPATGSDNQPAGKLFLLRPYTAEEYAAYQEHLRVPPNLSACKT